MQQQPGVVAAAPFVLTQAVVDARATTTSSGVFVVGHSARRARASPEVTTIRKHATAGDFRFATLDGQHRGAVLGKLLARAAATSCPGDNDHARDVCRSEARIR